ncbi:hypothetical protein JTE90_013437 [Oedothorax gibbosus]|uniref:Uncharacterized protein n=1 Tax=Oedothorax gibbosus TaxID=931172 RepID=A0AAV6TRF8_9ARAC|nr:hypothetical protein JTE90_013437 [Oedothorax gibbosus]
MKRSETSTCEMEVAGQLISALQESRFLKANSRSNLSAEVQLIYKLIYIQASLQLICSSRMELKFHPVQRRTVQHLPVQNIEVQQLL